MSERRYQSLWNDYTHHIIYLFIRCKRDKLRLTSCVQVQVAEQQLDVQCLAEPDDCLRVALISDLALCRVGSSFDFNFRRNGMMFGLQTSKRLSTAQWGSLQRPFEWEAGITRIPVSYTHLTVYSVTLFILHLNFLYTFFWLLIVLAWSLYIVFRIHYSRGLNILYLKFFNIVSLH